MKWRTAVFSLAVLLSLAAAFLLPGILLRRQMQAALNRTVVRDAGEALTDPAAEKTVISLQLMTDYRADAIPLSAEEDPTAQIDALRLQLDALKALGALPDSLYAGLAEPEGQETDVQRVCLVQPERRLLSEITALNLLPYPLEAVVDSATGKVLRLRFPSEDPTLLMQEMDETDSDGELAAWAEYLGLSPGEQTHTSLRFDQIRSVQNPLAPHFSLLIKTVLLTDGDGDSVLFGLSYSYMSPGGYYTWGPLEEGSTP